MGSNLAANIGNLLLNPSSDRDQPGRPVRHRPWAAGAPPASDRPLAAFYVGAELIQRQESWSSLKPFTVGSEYTR